MFYTPPFCSTGKCKGQVCHLTAYLFASTNLDSYLNSFSDNNWNNVYLVQRGELNNQRNLMKRKGSTIMTTVKPPPKLIIFGYEKCHVVPECSELILSLNCSPGTQNRSQPTTQTLLS